MNAANKQKLRVSTKWDDAFIAGGYKNWKRGTTGFKTDEASECHREQGSRKVIDIGGAKFSWGFGGTVSHPASPWQGPGGDLGGEAPRSSANLVILAPWKPTFPGT